jgi:hypothetical protein
MNDTPMFGRDPNAPPEPAWIRRLRELQQENLRRQQEGQGPDLEDPEAEWKQLMALYGRR